MSCPTISLPRNVTVFRYAVKDGKTTGARAGSSRRAVAGGGGDRGSRRVGCPVGSWGRRTGGHDNPRRVRTVWVEGRPGRRARQPCLHHARRRARRTAGDGRSRGRPRRGRRRRVPSPSVEHRSLYRVAVQQIPTSPQIVAGFLPTAGQAWRHLRERVARIEEIGVLGSRSIDEATLQFHALCEGLAALELRGLLSTGAEERTWRDAIASLVAGFAIR